MGGIIGFWARNTVAANLLMIMAIVGGFIGFSSLEKETFPGAELSGATIHISWPGASPQEAEEQLVVRIEEAIADVDGLERLTSVAREGGGNVYVRARNGTDKKEFLDEIKIRVDSINNLPQSSYRPQVRQWREGNQYFAAVVYGDIPPRELKEITETVRDEMARLPGGELAEVQATLAEEVTIELSEDDLRRYGLTFDEVAGAIRGASLNASGGEVKTATGSVNIQARQLADTAIQFENIILRQSANGGLVRVGDVARVIDGFEDSEMMSTHNGHPASYVMIPQTERMDLPSYANSLKEYVREKNKTLPESVRVGILWNDDDFLTKLISIIGNSAFQGTMLVLCILILFLRPIVAFWVSAGIITAFAGGFMLLPLMGVSLNILTLFACLLVIGVVVDDAIVVGENIHAEVESGRRDGVEAAIHATKQVSKPVIFGVLTTMIAFAPWALLSGDERQFTQNFTLTVIAALTFSLIEAFLILPSHLSHLKKQPTGDKAGRFTKFQTSIADSLLWFAANIYRPILEAAIRFRYATAALFIALFISAIGLTSQGYVPFRMMPEIEGDTVMVNIEMPNGTPFSRIVQVRDQLKTAVDALKADVNAEWDYLDKGDMIRSDSIVAHEGGVQAWVGLMLPEDRPTEVSSKDISEKLRDFTGPIPDAEETRFDFSFTGNDDRLRFALNHPDLDVLREAADELKEHLATYAEAHNIGDNISAAAEEVRLSLKPGASSLGLTLRDITRQVRQAYYGEEVQRLPREGDDVRVMLKLPEEARRSIDSLSSFRIRTADGREIPLTEVADIEFAPGVNMIQRRERQRSVAVFAEVPGESQAEIIRSVNRNFIPTLTAKYPGLSSGAIGSAERQQEFFGEIILLHLIAFSLMYCLLAVAFKSYFQPLLIMSAIPFGFAGAVFGHWMFGIPLAMFSIFGIAAAAGVVINDNLVLIDYLNRRRDQGAGALQAIIESGVARFRPILLTSVTTFIGILPMIMDRSTQAQFLKPMVVSLGCAVVFALFISLFMVPALYAVGVEVRRLARWIVKGVPYQHIGGNYDENEIDLSGDVEADILAKPAE